MYYYEMVFFNMQFCLVSSKNLELSPSFWMDVFMARSLAGSNCVSVSSIVIYEANHVAMDRLFSRLI